MHYHRLILGFFCMLLPFTVQEMLPITAKANTDNGANFTVSPVYPYNQVGGETGYFQLNVTPKQQGTLTIKIANNDTKKQHFSITPTRATTTDSGQINYSPMNRPPDKSAQTALPHLLTSAQQVTIPARSTKNVRFHYRVPHSGFNGTLLGGLYVYNTTRHSNQGGTVVNRYAMIIGLSLNEHPRRHLSPGLWAGPASVVRQGNSLLVQTKIRNYHPVYFRGMHLKATITKKGRKQVLAKQTMPNGSMAPNSYFYYTLNVSEQVIQPGHYTEHLRIHIHNRTWRFNRNFTITPADSVKQLIHVDHATHTWWIWLLLLLLLLAFGGGSYWLGQHKTKR